MTAPVASVVLRAGLRGARRGLVVMIFVSSVSEKSDEAASAFIFDGGEEGEVLVVVVARFRLLIIRVTAPLGGGEGEVEGLMASSISESSGLTSALGLALYEKRARLDRVERRGRVAVSAVSKSFAVSLATREVRIVKRCRARSIHRLGR